MAERTAEIKLLNEIDARLQANLLWGARIVPSNASDGRYFANDGTFVISTKVPGLADYWYKLWAEKLLGYHPDANILSIYRGQLIVREQDNTVVKSIPPEETRRVGLGVNLNDGGEWKEKRLAVITSRFIFYQELEKKVRFEELETLLLQAFKTTVKSPIVIGGNCIAPRMILCPGDSEPPKKQLWAIPLINPPGATYGYKDIAVIDPNTRTLLPR